MKILINIIVFSLFLMLPAQSYAFLTPDTTMPDSGLRVEVSFLI